MEELYGGSPSPRQAGPHYVAVRQPYQCRRHHPRFIPDWNIYTANGVPLSVNLLPLKYEVNGTVFDSKGESTKLAASKRKIQPLVTRLNAGEQPEKIKLFGLFPRRWFLLLALAVGFAFGTMVR